MKKFDRDETETIEDLFKCFDYQGCLKEKSKTGENQQAESGYLGPMISYSVTQGKHLSVGTAFHSRI